MGKAEELLDRKDEVKRQTDALLKKTKEEVKRQVMLLTWFSGAESQDAQLRVRGQVRQSYERKGPSRPGFAASDKKKMSLFYYRFV